MPIQEGAIVAYPQAERLELREELHGREVADPYRWLEDTGDPRTQEWSAAQDELFAACQARWRGGAAAGRLAILYGYGSFGSSRTPDFSVLRLAWVEAGGVYAIANVRGGGEEGEAWHRAGMRANKQAAVDDLHAAGDYLVDRGWTTRDRLGLHGGSAGGLLVGAALTQRPQAYAAVLCSAPDLDMVRYERFTLAAAAQEFGSAADPEEFGWLLAISPYHNVRPGAAYPATLFTVFEGDVRVPTLHARKMAAALQHATSAAPADRPILLRREFGVGHIPRGVSRLVPLWLDQLAFFATQLTPAGLPP
jgi:prolyl oligopeptidase